MGKPAVAGIAAGAVAGLVATYRYATHLNPPVDMTLDQLGCVYTSREAADYIGLPKSALIEGDYDKGYLAVHDPESGSYRYPAWQFSDGQLTPGFKEVVLELGYRNVDDLVSAQWLKTPQRRLDGHTPADWLTAGRGADKVLSLIVKAFPVR